MLRVLWLHSVWRMIGDGLYRSYKHIQVLIRQLCIKSYEKLCICVTLLQSGCHMHLLKNKNGVSMKHVVFIWKGNKMKERTWLNNIITIDETCVRAYEPELKLQSAEWRHEGSPRRQKFSQNPSPVKLMVILAYEVHGVICVMLCQKVKLLMHSTMLHICKITYVTQLSVNGHNCKMWSFCMIMLLHIRRFVSGICYDAGGGKYCSIHHTNHTFCLVIMI